MNQATHLAASYATRPLADLCDALLTQGGGTFPDDVALLAARLTH